MNNLFTGAMVCAAAGAISGVLYIAGRVMRNKRINRLLTRIDNRIQGKSARTAATVTSAKILTTISTYQKSQDLSREGK